MELPLKIGFLGASRGMDFAMRLSHAGYPYAKVAAVCEAYPVLCDKAKAFFTDHGLDVECYTDFDTFLSESGIDAVVIANYANEHAPYAIKALERGIHVFSEVMPAQTLAEAAALCDAVEKSGCVYAYGENYCYFDGCFAMRRHYEQGDIGEAVALEGTFINDCSPRWHVLTRGIRDHWRNFVPSTFYCSHSIGPMLYATGRRAVRVNGFEIPRMGYMKEGGARSGSAAMEMLELDNGGIARSMNGNYKHPYEVWYRLIGETGSIEATPTTVKIFKDKGRSEYDITEYAAKSRTFEFRPVGDHGSFLNADCASLGYFFGKILGDADAAKYSIDIYRALDMALPGLFAYRSIVDKGMPYDIPDFRDKTVRAKFANDVISTDPRTPEPFRLPTSKSGTPEVDDAVYEKVQADFRAFDLTVGGK